MGTIRPIHEWNLKNCNTISITDEDTKLWAEFIINNLTQKNQSVLQGFSMFIRELGWLNETTAGLFGSIIEDRTKSLIRAIDSGVVSSKKFPSLRYQRERHVLGAAICELVAQGYGSEFLNSLA